MKRAGEFQINDKPQQPPSTPTAAIKRALWEKNPNNALTISQTTGVHLSHVVKILGRLEALGEVTRTMLGEWAPVDRKVSPRRR